MIALSISESTLHCRDHVEQTGWDIRVNEIVLIAEYTSEEGEKTDDYFLAFVTQEKDELFYSNVTLNASGVSEVLDELEKRVGVPLELKLHSTRGWNSRVLWPPPFTGTPYYQFEQPAPTTIWDRILRRVRRTRPAYRIADPIQDYLSKVLHPE